MENEQQYVDVNVHADLDNYSTRDHPFYFSNTATGQYYEGFIEIPYIDYRFRLPSGSSVDLTGDDTTALLTQLVEIENRQLELSEQSAQVQYNTYTMTAYIFVAVLAFGLLNLFKGVISSILGG